MAQCGEFTYEKAFDILGQEKKSEQDTVTIKNDILRKYFPRNYTPRQMEEKIIQLWMRGRKAAAPQRTLTRNARPMGSFFVCKNLETNY